jgi:hypothetical protein
MEFQQMSKFGQFTIEVFIHSIESFLQLFLREFAYRIMCWVVVNIGKKDCLREGRFDMFPGTAVTMSACTYL